MGYLLMTRQTSETKYLTEAERKLRANLAIFWNIYTSETIQQKSMNDKSNSQLLTGQTY